MKRSPALVGGWEWAALHLERMATGGALWLLVWLTLTQPLHLVQEVHALLPASARHHAVIHCEEARAALCEKPRDDVAQPLSGAQHERHHAARCASDGQLAHANLDALSAAPQGGHWIALDFAPVSLAPHLEIPASPRQSRAPPQSAPAPQSPSLSFSSGRAPPIKA